MALQQLLLMPDAMSSQPTFGFTITDNSHTYCPSVFSARQLCHVSSQGPLASVRGTIWGAFHTFPQRMPSRIEPHCSQSNLLLNVPLNAFLPSLSHFFYMLTGASWDHFTKLPAPGLRVSFGENHKQGKYLPQPCCGHQSRIIKLSLVGCLFKQETTKQVGG